MNSRYFVISFYPQRDFSLVLVSLLMVTEHITYIIIRSCFTSEKRTLEFRQLALFLEEFVSPAQTAAAL